MRDPPYRVEALTTGLANPDHWGPLDEYDERVHSRQLRDDEHQRGVFRFSGSIGTADSYGLSRDRADSTGSA